MIRHVSAISFFLVFFGSWNLSDTMFPCICRGMVFMCCPVIAGDGVINGLRGESRQCWVKVESYFNKL